MKLIVNGEEIILEGVISVKALMERFHCDMNATALAVNRMFVPRNLRDKIEFKDGDEVELIVPMQGG